MRLTKMKKKLGVLLACACLGTSVLSASAGSLSVGMEPRGEALGYIDNTSAWARTTYGDPGENIRRYVRATVHGTLQTGQSVTPSQESTVYQGIAGVSFGSFGGTSYMTSWHEIANHGVRQFATYR